MNEQHPEGDEKKIRIKPRGLRTADGWEADAAVAPPPKITNKLAARALPAGTPFEARAHTRQKPAPRGGDEVPAAPEPAREAEPPAAPAPAPEQAPQPAAASSEGTAARRKTDPGTLRWLYRVFRRRVRLWHALLFFLPCAGLAGWAAYALGGAIQQASALDAAAKKGVTIPGDVQARIDAALADLRAGDARKALDALVPVEQEHPDVSSLTYLVALAAMQAGEAGLSEKKTDESIEKRERISDSLALKAVLETQKQLRGFGDPSIRSEAYLRRAMAADAANPHPIIELATLLRYKNRDEEAASLLAAAKSRLNPVDSHAVVETTLSLLDLQVRSDADLPSDLDPDKDISSLFSAAYVAMRKGDYGRAATILRLGKERLPPDFFDYLVNDPALRKFSSRPGLQEFYE